jgi:hypothetical protein
MLIGQTPFSGDNPMTVAYEHVHSDVPPVSAQRPDTPGSVDDLVRAATRWERTSGPQMLVLCAPFCWTPDAIWTFRRCGSSGSPARRCSQRLGHRGIGLRPEPGGLLLRGR